MKKLIVFILLITVAFIKAEEKKFGKPITLKEKTSVSIILADPAKYDGKKVLVEGKIIDVCKEMGCWLDVAGTKEGEKIRVKVEDGAIVFPKDSKDKTALVEGVIVQIKEDKCRETEPKDEKEASGCPMNKAKDAKASTDKKEAGCCSGEETAKAYQIQGLGAVIR